MDQAGGYWISTLILIFRFNTEKSLPKEKAIVNWHSKLVDNSKIIMVYCLGEYFYNFSCSSSFP